MRPLTRRYNGRGDQGIIPPMLNRRTFVVLLVAAAILAACRDQGATPSTESGGLAQPQVTTPTIPPASPTPSETPTPEPTPTPTEPMAAMVNGRPITLRAYEAELLRYQQGQAELGRELSQLPEDYRQIVLNALIERELVLDAAEDAGVAVDDAAVEAQVAELREALGEAGLADWQQRNNYDEEDLLAALRAELTTQEMMSRVTADVPTAVEQVRARYIQFDDPALADEALGRARAGDDFGFLAQQYSVDRLTGELGGDLGFFAAGSLLVPELEAAAFALQPDEISDVISVTDATGKTTYYVIQVLERDPARELTADGRLPLLQTAFDEWLNGLLESARVERFVE